MATRHLTRPGNFLIEPAREIYGELQFRKNQIKLHLQDELFFNLSEIDHNFISGRLFDLTFASLFGCVSAPFSGRRSRGTGSFHYAEVFPQYLALGDCVIRPFERSISRVRFTTYDTPSIFFDPSTSGSILPDEDFISRIKSHISDELNQDVHFGEMPFVWYSTGRESISRINTSIGTITARPRDLSISGKKSKSKVWVDIKFDDLIDFNLSIERLMLILLFWEYVSGRPQKLRSHIITVKYSNGEEHELDVKWMTPWAENYKSPIGLFIRAML